MAALEGGDLDSIGDALSLLVVVLPSTPSAPVRAKFKHIAQLLITIGRAIHAEDSQVEGQGGGTRTATLRHLLEAVSMSASHLDASTPTWSAPAALQCLDFLVRHFDDRRAKIRKAAHEQVLSLVRAHRLSNPTSSPLLARLGDACAQTLLIGQGGSSADTAITQALHLIPFLRESAASFPPPQMEAVASRLLACASNSHGHNSALLAAQALDVLTTMSPSLSAPSLSVVTAHLLATKPSPSSTSGDAALREASSWINLTSS
jgi:hypothetical protein